MSDLKIFSVWLPESFIQEMKMHCVANGVTVQEFVYAKLNEAVHGCDCGACTECTMAGYRKMRDK